MVVWGGWGVGMGSVPPPPCGGSIAHAGGGVRERGKERWTTRFSKGWGGGVEPPLCRGHGGAHLD